MQFILYVSCSPKGSAAVSLGFADLVVARLLQRYPGARIGRRDLASEPPRFVDAAFCSAIMASDGGASAAFDESEILIRELEAADAVVIATPMHNFSVPAVLKAWIDQVVRIHRSFASTPAGKVGTLNDRPVFVVVASGGWFTGPSPNGAPAQPDFLTPYLTSVLNVIGLHEIHFLTLEGVTRGPEMMNRAVALAHQTLDRILPDRLG